jgi:hypothetical protein
MVFLAAIRSHENDDLGMVQMALGESHIQSLLSCYGNI